MLLVVARGEKAVLREVKAVQLHHSVMDTWTDCSVVASDMKRNGSSA